MSTRQVYRRRMVFVRLAWFPGGTRDDYAAIADAMGGVLAPAARRVFIAGPLDDGWQVVQVWDSRDDLERFNAEVLSPALTRHGVAGFPETAVIRDFEAVEGSIGDRLIHAARTHSASTVPTHVPQSRG